MKEGGNGSGLFNTLEVTLTRGGTCSNGGKCNNNGLL